MTASITVSTILALLTPSVQRTDVPMGTWTADGLWLPPEPHASRIRELQARLKAEAEPQTVFLRVAPAPGNPDDASELRRRIAGAMNDALIPPPGLRVAYYRAANHPNLPPIVGWHGMLEAFEPIPGGYLVRIRVQPFYNWSLHDGLTVLEWYAVTDRGISLVRWEYPTFEFRPGMVGT